MGKHTGRHAALATGWWRRFSRQLWALTWYKSARVAYRNLTATVLRVLVAPFLFILLTFVVVKGIEASPTYRQAGSAVATRPFASVAPIPDCTTDVYYSPRQTCWDLLFTPNTSDVVQGIVAAMRQNNAGRPIPPDRVLGFASVADSNAFLLGDLQRRANGAVHFNVSGAGVSFVLQTNSTVRSFKGQFQNPTFFSQVPIQVAAEREIARYHYSLAGRRLDPADWAVQTAGYPHPPLVTASLAGSVLGPFLFAANMFSFVLVLAALVGERCLRLRQAMRTMGLLDSAYWLHWAAHEFVLALATSLLTCALGSLFQFRLFYGNSWALPFLLFLLFQLAMSSFAFVLSTILKTPAAAINSGFAVFLVGWIMQLVAVFGFPYSPSYLQSDRWAVIVFSLFPWSLLAKAVADLGDAAVPGSPGIPWGDRAAYCQNLGTAQVAQQPPSPNAYRDYQCILSLNAVLIILLVEWLAYLLLAVWLDNVLPNESGTRRAPWYFCLPNYWAPSRRRNLRRAPGAVATAAGPQLLRPPLPTAEGEELDDDVAAEKARMQELLQHRTAAAGAMAAQAEGAGGNAVELFGLQRRFDGTSRLRNLLCCGRGRRDAFWAIRGSWLAIPEGQLFCLLGPNGAGKTTTISCLTGVIPPSGGDALVHGEALSSPGGMDRIRRVMGVCPQFDILWGELTGREHLLIYGTLKGLPLPALRREADELLARVKLSAAGGLRTGSYSGGMRRRLSVAIALLGDPKIVFLDEPTTGMDPVSRRQVWDIIQEAKQGRAIVLTTHSMEEADVLGDRIAIMARGQVRCLGSSLRLKQRFGTGYQLALAHASEQKASAAAETRAFVERHLGSLPCEQSGAYLQFRVPRSAEAGLPAFLAALEAERQALGVADVQISLTSLEEVFLTIARGAEREAAARAGETKHSVFVDAGATELQVELGAEEAVHPETGLRYAVRWAQDDAGALQILEAVLIPGQEQPAQE